MANTSATTTPAVEPVRKLLYTTREAAAALGICEKTLYTHLLHGQLRSLRIGATRRIPVAALEEYIERQMASESVQARSQVNLGTCAHQV